MTVRAPVDAFGALVHSVATVGVFPERAVSSCGAAIRNSGGSRSTRAYANLRLFAA